MELRRREVWRYLGYHGATPQAAEQQKIEIVIAQMEKAVTPRHIYLEKPCSVDGDGVEIEGIRFSSALLARNLAGCERVILMAATLGAEADLQVRRYQARSMAEATIAQAVCAELLECYLDDVCGKIAQEKAENGLFLRPRYSPGYGDLALEAQRDQIEREAEKIRQEIKADMEEKQVEELAAGAYIVRWKTVLSNRLDSKALKAALPEIYKQYSKTSESRRFTVS